MGCRIAGNGLGGCVSWLVCNRFTLSCIPKWLSWKHFSVVPFQKLEFLKQDRKVLFAKLFSGTLQTVVSLEKQDKHKHQHTHTQTHTQRFSAALFLLHKCWSPVDIVILLTFGKIVELGPKPTITEITLYEIFSEQSGRSQGRALEGLPYSSSLFD